ncbi:unnamed protein product [Euphydryas editha]|uniref:Uncharacterized protein n=1 Tax=Euphydryas editha TaxID=104508 RepID=A0AAU9TGQ6_EUPED|nr:unnamed protein product [Euphydryas editha]
MDVAMEPSLYWKKTLPLHILQSDLDPTVTELAESVETATESADTAMESAETAAESAVLLDLSGPAVDAVLIFEINFSIKMNHKCCSEL